MRSLQNQGNQALSFGKGNRARLYGNEKEKVVFKRIIASSEEAKQDLTEVVDFLKNPKFTALKFKGVLLVGPPRPGKNHAVPRGGQGNKCRSLVLAVQSL